VFFFHQANARNSPKRAKRKNQIASGHPTLNRRSDNYW